MGVRVNMNVRAREVVRLEASAAYLDEDSGDDAKLIRLEFEPDIGRGLLYLPGAPDPVVLTSADLAALSYLLQSMENLESLEPTDSPDPSDEGGGDEV